MNRKGLINIAAIVLLVMAIFAMIAIADSGNSQKVFSSDKKLNLIVQQMDSSLSTEKQKNDFSVRLATLKPDEAIALKKMWRADLVLKGTITQKEALAFPALEKIEIIFSQKIKELYGEDATIYNISPSEFSKVEAVLADDIIIKELTASVEDTLTSASAQFATASSCYYDNNWPQWLTAVAKSTPYYIGGGSGRVANDAPDEWPCDFVIYVPAYTYTKVTGLNGAAQNVVDYSGGLSASPSRDAVIVGYKRVLLYGWPTEYWVRNYILLKT